MGGGSKTTTTSNAVSPWIPGESTFDMFKERAAGTITPEFEQSLLKASDTVSSAANLPEYAPGIQQTLIGQMQGGAGNDQYFDSVTQKAPGIDANFLATTNRAQNPYLRSQAFNNVKQNVIADVMPAINSTFAGTGMTGSSLHQQNLAKGLTQGIANVENQAFQQGENRALAAGQAAQAASNQNYQQMLNGAGMRQDALRSGQGQELQAANLMNTAFGQNYARRLGIAQAQQGLGSTYQGAQSQALNSLLSAAVGGSSNTGSTTQSQNPGVFGMLGAGAQIASLFSDERLKTDKKQVGELDDGTPVYTFKYKEGVAPEGLEGKTLMGVMASKVKNKKAVEDDPSGFKRVNYGAL